MRYILLIVIIFFLLPIPAMGYYRVGNKGEGTQIYAKRGLADKTTNSKITLIVISELANMSHARNWEVSIVVLPDNEEISYLLDVRDSHLAKDDTKKSDKVKLTDNGEGIGTTVYGPFLVWASADTDLFGDLIWDLTLMSRDGRDIYVHYVMRWGWGIDNPPKIVGKKEVDSQISTPVGKIMPRVIWITAIAIIFAGFRAYGKATNDRISGTDVPKTNETR